MERWLSKNLLCLAALMCVLACEQRDVRKVSELDGSRVLGLALSPHVVDLNALPDSLSVQIVDYVEDGEAEYNWTVCASIGAISRYECLPDTPILEGLSDSPFFEIPFDLSRLATSGDLSLGTDFSDWVPNPCPNHEVVSCADQSACPLGALCVEGGCRSVTELYPIEFIVKVKPTYDGVDERVAAMNLPIFAGASNNQRIELNTVTIGDVTIEPDERDCTETALVTQSQVELPLAVAVDLTSLDVFQTAGDAGCDTVNEISVGTVSWYATDGELKKPLSDLDSPTNTLSLSAGTESVRLYLVVRDGRGTLDGRCVTLIRE